MPCSAELRRRFADRAEAIRYLARRGFLCAAQGWVNGRWAATLSLEAGSYHVAIWLRMSEAA